MDSEQTEDNEYELRYREFEQAVEQAGHSIVITDTEGTIEYVNPAFERITGYTREEVLGTNPRILKSDEHDEEFYEQLWNTILAGEVWHAEIVNEGKDGDRIIVNQTIAPILDSVGEPERFVAINHDITKRKKIEQQLQEQRDNLDLLNQTVRHDIRNDLQLILAYGELLEESLDNDQQKYLDKILESATNAVGLTKTARGLAEVMLQTEYEPQPIALDDVIDAELKSIRRAYLDADIKLSGELPDVAVSADEMLDSVLRNLLKNAVQHNDKDKPEVRVLVTEIDDGVQVSVADNGPGVPDTQKDEIFGKGEQGLDSNGTGIGLYLVQTLVTRYGGDVWVEDNDPEGAVFTIQLPTIDGASFRRNNI